MVKYKELVRGCKRKDGKTPTILEIIKDKEDKFNLLVEMIKKEKS